MGCQRRPNHPAVSSLPHLFWPWPLEGRDVTREASISSVPWRIVSSPGLHISADVPQRYSRIRAWSVVLLAPPCPPDFAVRGPRQVRRKLQSRDTFHCKRTRSGRSGQGWICTGSRTILGPAIVMRVLPLSAAGARGSLEHLLPGRSGIGIH